MPIRREVQRVERGLLGVRREWALQLAHMQADLSRRPGVAKEVRDYRRQYRALGLRSQVAVRIGSWQVLCQWCSTQTHRD